MSREVSSTLYDMLLLASGYHSHTAMDLVCGSILFDHTARKKEERLGSAGRHGVLQ